MDRDLVDCIVRFHDIRRLNELSRCVFSLVGQTYRPLNVILVLQRFTADSIAETRKAIVPLLRLPGAPTLAIENWGEPSPLDARAALLNLGLAAAKGRYVGFLDYDDVLYPEAYTTLVERIQSTGTAIAFANVRFVEASIHPHYIAVAQVINAAWGTGLADLFKGNFCPIHSYLIDRSKVSREVLNSDSRLTLEEDYDLLLRICSQYPSDFGLRGIQIGDYYHKSDESNRIVYHMSESQVREYKLILAQIEHRRRTTLVAPVVQRALGFPDVRPGMTIRGALQSLAGVAGSADESTASLVDAPPADLLVTVDPGPGLTPVESNPSPSWSPSHANIKNLGYELGRRMAPALGEIDISEEPSIRNLVSKPTNQSDVESPWFVYWCRQLKIVPIYHRKLWEFAFVLQALYESGLLTEGTKGIGFGCGKEPLAAYFASKKIKALVTDLPPEQVAGMGWAETGQHLTTREMAFDPELVDRRQFDEFVTHRYLDMNDIPDLDETFDFCWSVCALEHIGSIENGLKFIENSLKVLRLGGIAVHTTEFNYLHKDQTLDNCPTVLFLRKHFEELATRMARLGHVMYGPNFDMGDGVLDRFIDVPPYAFGEGWFSMDIARTATQAGHLRLSVDGFSCTCYGIIIKKRA